MSPPFRLLAATRPEGPETGTKRPVARRGLQSGLRLGKLWVVETPEIPPTSVGMHGPPSRRAVCFSGSRDLQISWPARDESPAPFSSLTVPVIRVEKVVQSGGLTRVARASRAARGQPLALSGIFWQGNEFLWYNRRTVQPGTAMTVKEMGQPSNRLADFITWGFSLDHRCQFSLI
jgi:hypothetical protein